MIKHYSNSSISKRSDCGKKFEYRYIAEMHEKIKPSLVIGSMVDRAVNAIHLKKMEVGSPLDPVMEMFNHLRDEKMLFGKEMKDEDWDECSSIADLICEENLLEEFEDMIDYEPLHVQMKIQFRIKGVSLPIIGYPDVIARRDNPAFSQPGDEFLISDVKTSKSKISKISHGYKTQLSTYVLGWMWKHGKDVIPQTELRVLVKTKKPYWMVLPVSLTADDLGVTIEAYREHEHAINAKWFPMNRASHFCSLKNCGFYEICHNENSYELKNVMEKIQYAN